LSIHVKKGKSGELEHQSSKTTEIYTHVTEKGIKNIASPLDKLMSRGE